MPELEPWSPEMEPDLSTDPALLEVLIELSSREPIFHRHEHGTTLADCERGIAQDFWEVGASGRRYSRDYVLRGLEKRHAAPRDDVWEAKDFHCRTLGEGFYLLTYTLLQDRERLTRRSTIWQSTADGWEIVYHQGTIVKDRPFE